MRRRQRQMCIRDSRRSAVCDGPIDRVSLEQQQQREQRQRAGFHWSGEAQDVYLALALHQAGGGGRA